MHNYGDFCYRIFMRNIYAKYFLRIFENFGFLKNVKSVVNIVHLFLTNK